MANGRVDPPLGQPGWRSGHQRAPAVERLSAAGFRVDTARRGKATAPVDPVAHARAEHQAKAREKACIVFPNVDPATEPQPPPSPPGLYTLVEHTSEILPPEVMVDLHRPVTELRDLLAQGQLHRKVAAAWGSLSFDPDLAVSFST